jgi:pimeloyl-ACP methyl ester carboxylesterase
MTSIKHDLARPRGAEPRLPYEKKLTCLKKNYIFCRRILSDEGGKGNVYRSQRLSVQNRLIRGRATNVPRPQRVDRQLGVMAAARLLESACEREFNLALSDITLPTVVIHGRQDAIVPLKIGEQLTRAIPGAELVVLEGVGDAPTMTRPQEVVAAIEQRFLNCDD